MNNLNNAHKNGGWVLLQNIHLTIDWTSGPLEKKVRGGGRQHLILCSLQNIHPVQFPNRATQASWWQWSSHA
jgi:hypothetical protein